MQVVVHGAAVTRLRRDDYLNADFQRIIDRGVHIGVCNVSMTRKGMLHDSILAGVELLTEGGIAFVVAVAVGVTLGVTAAIRQNTWLDYCAVGLSIVAQVLPNFVMAPILVLVFTLWLGWLPGGGWGGPIFWIMPVIALSTSFMASIAVSAVPWAVITRIGTRFPSTDSRSFIQAANPSMTGMPRSSKTAS